MAVVPAIWPECLDSCLVFMNGALSVARSSIPPGCVIQHVSPFEISIHLMQSLPFNHPLQIIHFGDSQNLHIKLLVEKNVRADVIETIEKETFDLVIDVSLSCGAEVRWMEWTKSATGKRFFTATVDARARLNYFFYSQDMQLFSRNLSISLRGDAAQAEMKGLDCLKKENRVETMCQIVHRATQCRSLQHMKHVLFDAAELVCENRARVEKSARRAEVNQRLESLMLSDFAKASVQPILEIFSHDSVAHHGATFSQIRPEELFYCQTRGLSKEAACQLLIDAFCQDMLRQAPYDLRRE